MSADFVVDFHNHHIPSRFESTAARTFPANQQARWLELNRKLADEDLLLQDIRSGDLNMRVVNTPAALLADAEGHLPPETIVAINDELAELAARHPGRIRALATIDAYDGERAGREVERAVKELKLTGIFVDSARGDLLIDAPQARPALEAAAGLGVPVFVHPVNPQPLTDQMSRYGRLGVLFARGTVNSATLIALIESGTFTQLPGLKVVVTALAFGGLAMASGFAHHSILSEGTIAALRKHVWIDTMGFDPAQIRASIDILGADRVIAGSDWPIVNEGPIRQRLLDALALAGVAEKDKALVTGANALALVGA